MQQALREDSRLQGGRYRIVKVLGSGGFGITYLAIQSGQGRQVAVKEFFMKDRCNRDKGTSRVSCGSEGSRQMVDRFRAKFLKEARNLARLNHVHIVKVTDVFEENDTVYYVMEYAEGGSLADKVKREGYLSEAVAIRYILQVADALDYIHQRSMNHLDVKPGNIMLNERDEAILIDFGLSKQYDATTGEQSSTTPVGISEGYAPTEQYNPGGVSKFSPQTDIYSLGATLFKLLTGSTPPNASEVNEDGVPVDKLQARGICQPVIDTICQAMESRKKDRLQNIQAFVSALKAQPEKAKEEEPEDTLPQDAIGHRQNPVPAPPRVVETPRNNPPRQEKRDYSDTIPQERNDNSKKPVPAQANNGFAKKLKKAFLSILGREEFPAKKKDLGNVASYKSPKQMPAKPVTPPTTGTMNGHEWVDLGLPSGTKWATMNVGANSPWDYGDYFAWGETSPKSRYDWDSLKYCLDAEGHKFSKYVTDSKWGMADGKRELEPCDDAAYVNWGIGWRMPSRAQQDELREKCTWTWTTIGGHSGYKVVGPNGNSLFLPAAGYRIECGLYDVGSNGQCWSRMSSASSGAYSLYFSFHHVGWNNYVRRNAQSIRAVLTN